MTTDHWSDHLPELAQVVLFWVALAIVVTLAPVWRVIRWIRLWFGSKDE